MKRYLMGVRATADKITMEKIVVETEEEMQRVLKEISKWPEKISSSRVSSERSFNPPPVLPRRH